MGHYTRDCSGKRRQRLGKSFPSSPLSILTLPKASYSLKVWSTKGNWTKNGTTYRGDLIPTTYISPLFLSPSHRVDVDEDSFVVSHFVVFMAVSTKGTPGWEEQTATERWVRGATQLTKDSFTWSVVVYSSVRHVSLLTIYLRQGQDRTLGQLCLRGSHL